MFLQVTTAMNVTVTLNTTGSNASWFNWSNLPIREPAIIPPEISIAGAIFGVMIVILGAFGNVLLILAVILSKPLYKISNLFVISLAVCDLFQTLLVKPLYIHTYVTGEWIFGKHVCLYALFASNLAILESILHICAIAFHRYAVFVHPRMSGILRHFRTVLVMLVLIYVLPLMFIMLPAIPKIRTGEVIFNKKIMFCSFVKHQDFRMAGVLKKVIFLGLAAIFLFYCYLRIYHVVRISGQSVNDSHGTLNPVRLRREMTLLKTIAVIFLTFLVCYLPLSILYAADKHRTAPYFVYFLGVLLLWMSSSVNWMIYGLMNEQYRHAYRLILHCTIYHVNKAQHKENGSSSRLSKSDRASGLKFVSSRSRSHHSYGPPHTRLRPHEPGLPQNGTRHKVEQMNSLTL